MAALQVLAAIKERGEPASKVLRQFNPLPQVLQNVRVSRKEQRDGMRAQQLAPFANERSPNELFVLSSG